MLQTIITNEFAERFNKLDNRCADVYIKHLLYGSQKIKKCILHPFMDGDCIGLIMNEEKIYITMDELSYIGNDNNKYIIKSEVMELYINLL